MLVEVESNMAKIEIFESKADNKALEDVRKEINTFLENKQLIGINVVVEPGNYSEWLMFVISYEEKRFKTNKYNKYIREKIRGYQNV
jgi:hypothetical protein